MQDVKLLIKDLEEKRNTIDQAISALMPLVGKGGGLAEHKNGNNNKAKLHHSLAAAVAGTPTNGTRQRIRGRRRGPRMAAPDRLNHLLNLMTPDKAFTANQLARRAHLRSTSSVYAAMRHGEASQVVRKTDDGWMLLRRE
jgi:hypothetical protein